VIFISILSTSNIFSSNTENENCCTNVVKFHVMGCDTCGDLQYCIDGGIWNYVDVCQFSWNECTQGYHTICVECLFGKYGTLRFYCQGSEWVQDEYVYVVDKTGNTECDCSSSK
jgi:hypothetical protein